MLSIEKQPDTPLNNTDRRDMSSNIESRDINELKHRNHNGLQYQNDGSRASEFSGPIAPPRDYAHPSQLANSRTKQEATTGPSPTHIILHENQVEESHDGARKATAGPAPIQRSDMHSSDAPQPAAFHYIKERPTTAIGILETAQEAIKDSEQVENHPSLQSQSRDNIIHAEYAPKGMLPYLNVTETTPNGSVVSQTPNHPIAPQPESIHETKDHQNFVILNKAAVPRVDMDTTAHDLEAEVAQASKTRNEIFFSPTPILPFMADTVPIEPALHQPLLTSNVAPEHVVPKSVPYTREFNASSFSVKKDADYRKANDVLEPDLSSFDDPLTSLRHHQHSSPEHHGFESVNKENASYLNTSPLEGHATKDNEHHDPTIMEKLGEMEHNMMHKLKEFGGKIGIGHGDNVNGEHDGKV